MNADDFITREELQNLVDETLLCFDEFLEESLQNRFKNFMLKLFTDIPVIFDYFNPLNDVEYSGEVLYFEIFKDESDKNLSTSFQIEFNQDGEISVDYYLSSIDENGDLSEVKDSEFFENIDTKSAIKLLSKTFK